MLAGLAVVISALLVATGGTGSLVTPGGDANIGAGIVLYYALSRLGGGLAARVLSLLAARAGHPRPWSLWIEAMCFFAAPLLLDRAIGL